MLSSRGPSLAALLLSGLVHQLQRHHVNPALIGPNSSPNKCCLLIFFPADTRHRCLDLCNSHTPSWRSMFPQLLAQGRPSHRTPILIQLPPGCAHWHSSAQGHPRQCCCHASSTDICSTACFQQNH